MATKRGGNRRLEVFARDKGVCALCGLDTESIKRNFYALKAKGDWDAVRNAVDWLLRWGRNSIRSTNVYRDDPASDYIGVLWHADHIVPLSENGPDTMENLRTLCLRCHFTETNWLRRRLNQRKRDAGIVTKRRTYRVKRMERLGLS